MVASLGLRPQERKPVQKPPRSRNTRRLFMFYFLLLINATSTISKQFMIPMKIMMIS